MSVPCVYPVREYPEQELPETSERCTHDYCIEVEGYRLSRPKSLSQAEIEEIEADDALMDDEFHGRNVAGQRIW